MTGQLDIHQKHELLELLFALREGVLGPPEAQRLESLVLAHEEAQQMYVEWMNMRAGLHRRRNGGGVPAIPGEFAAKEPVDLDSVDLHRVGWHGAWQTIRRIANDYMALSLLVSAILIANLLLVLALIIPGGDDPPAAADGPSLREIVANITNTSGASWHASSDGNFRERSLLLGDRLVLDGGLAEITFATGAQVTLEGPAEFTIGKGKHEAGGHDHANAGYLKRGALLATCETPDAQGFTIVTPQATVVDLSTVFAVTVGEDEGTTAHVIEGEVELRQADEPIILTAGRTAVISSEGVLTLESAEPQELRTRFARFKLAPPPTAKQVVNVDLGSDPNARYIGLAAAPDLRTNTYWNSFGRGQPQALLASDGKTPTAVGFVTGAGASGQLPGQQRIGLLDDYDFQWTRNGPFTLTLTGLSPEAKYNIYLYASTPHNQGAVFTIGEQTKIAAGTMLDGLAPGINFVRFAAIAPTPDGQILITVAENGQSAAILNGFQIVELETAGDDRVKNGQ